MIYYLDQANGDVYAYETIESMEKYGPKTLRPMTEQEVYDHLNPPKSAAQLGAEEAAWRSEEMRIARENVISIQFGDPSIPGTEQAWKDYWLSLRDWVEGESGYPDLTKRPSSPQ